MISKEMYISFTSIDFDLLKSQKKLLLALQGSSLINKQEGELLEGIINLFDAIQDQAVDNYGLNENEVFDFTEKT